MKVIKSISRRVKKILESDHSVVVVIICFVVVSTSQVFAAADPFAQATGEIKGYQESVRNLLYAIAAVIALVGAFSVYNKMTNGDQDVKKTIMLTLGGCIAMVALSTALPSFFE